MDGLAGFDNRNGAVAGKGWDMTKEEEHSREDAWRIAIDGTEHVVFRHRIPAAEVFDLAERSPHEWVLEVGLPGGGRATLDPGEHVDLAHGVTTHFFLRERHRHHEHGGSVGLVVVVNSDPVAVDAKGSQVLATIVEEVLERAKAAGRAEEEWELKTEAGVVLDQSLTVEAAGLHDGTTLFLSLKAGAAGDAAGELLVDPAVSKAKFDAEVSGFRRAAAEHGRRGIWLVRADHPTVTLVFAAPNWGPLRVLAFGAVVDFRNYDLWAPSVRLVDPITLVPFTGADIPLQAQLMRRQALEPATPGATGQFAIGRLMQWHLPDEVPFLCHAGVREYHDHAAHTGDSWLLHRGGNEGTLSRIVEILFQYGSSKMSGLGIVPTCSMPDA